MVEQPTHRTFMGFIYSMLSLTSVMLGAGSVCGCCGVMGSELGKEDAILPTRVRVVLLSKTPTLRSAPTLAQTRTRPHKLLPPPIVSLLSSPLLSFARLAASSVLPLPTAQLSRSPFS